MHYLVNRLFGYPLWSFDKNSK